MDRETIIRIVVTAILTMAILLGYQFVWPKLFPPAAPGPAPGKPAAEKPAGEKPAGEKPPVPPVEKPSETPGPAAKAAVLLRAVGAPAGERPSPAVLGSDAYGGKYDFQVEIVPEGAAIRRLTLSRDLFLKTVADNREPRAQRQPMDLVLPNAPFAAFLIPELKVWLTGVEGFSKADLAKVVWRASARETTAERAVFEVDVLDAADKVLLTVRRIYTVSPSDHSQGAPLPTYDMGMGLEFVKADDRVERVAYTLQGPPALPREDPRTDARQCVVGMRMEPKIEINWYPSAKYEPGKGLPPEEMPLVDVPGTKVQWFGEVERYFAVVAIPGARADGKFEAQAGDFYAVTARVFHYTAHESGVPFAVAGARLETRQETLPKGRPLRHDYQVFAGPKQHQVLEKYYRPFAFPDLIQWGGCCMFGGFTWANDLFAGVSRFMVILLDGLHTVVRNYGVAVILLVIVLRVVLHPVTRWSTKSMMKMQKLGPKMQAIREQYADDKERMNQEMAKFAKEEGFNPVSGCLPMGIQMPIWIGLYGALQSAIELRHAAFIPVWILPPGSLFLQDLAQPDMLFHWTTPFFIPGRELFLLGYAVTWIQSMLSGAGGITSLNVLPLLMGVTMWLQQRLTPTTAATAGPQAQQQKTMMVFMTVFMALVLYSAPAGLCLYIFTSSLLGWAEMRYLKKRYEALEAAAGAGGAAGAAVAGSSPKPPPPPAKKKPLVASGRDRSPAERIQAWLQKRLGGAKEPEPKKKGKGRK